LVSKIINDAAIGAAFLFRAKFPPLIETAKRA
jgi:hypothetical protein